MKVDSRLVHHVLFHLKHLNKDFHAKLTMYLKLRGQKLFGFENEASLLYIFVEIYRYMKTVWDSKHFMDL